MWGIGWIGNVWIIAAEWGSKGKQCMCSYTIEIFAIICGIKGITENNLVIIIYLILRSIVAQQPWTRRGAHTLPSLGRCIACTCKIKLKSRENWLGGRLKDGSRSQPNAFSRDIGTFLYDYVRKFRCNSSSIMPRWRTACTWKPRGYQLIRKPRRVWCSWWISACQTQ